MSRLREIDIHLTQFFEELEAIDAERTAAPHPEHDKPIPFELYEEILRAGYDGPRPTWNELIDRGVARVRELQRRVRLRLEEGQEP